MDLAVVISLILVVVYIGIAIIGYWRKYLFSLPIEYKNDLKAGIISDSIKRAFRENNFPLSITARIVTEDESANPEKKEPNTDTKEVNNDKKDEKEEQKSWFIEDNEKLYLINESKDKINVYQRLGILEKYDFQMMGPFLMWRTEKGKKLIDKIAKKRTFWKTYGTIAIVIAIISMIFNMALLIIEDIMATEIPESAAPTPQMIIGLPGINPYIPIWYGILGLAVAIIIHEFAHGILSRVGKITIKSLGILFCVVPVGAFVEPDETEIMSVDKRTRARMFAAGPSTNVIFSLICAMLFSWVFMGSIAPVHDGIIVTQIVKDSPAMQKELLPGMGIIGAYVIENNEITPQWYDVSDLYEYGKMLNETSGKRLALQVDDSYTIADNTTLVHRIYILDSDPILPSRLGIVLSPEVTYVQPNSNAELVGINTKMTFVSITDGTKTVSPNSPLDYYKFLTDHKPGDNVSVLMDINGSIQAYTITLEDLSNFTKDSNDIGIATPGFGTSVIINKIEKWSPAWGVKSAGISPGMLIYRIAKISNGTIDQNSITYLKGPTDFTNFM
ncbi:MAG: site-2 protease family protein, partial [Thermoplasmata archaeon]